MEFLKELFNGGAMTFDQLSAAVKSKGLSVVNAAGGAYVPKADVDGLNGQITTLTGQLNDANKQLEDLKKNEETAFLFVSDQKLPKLKTGITHQSNGTGTPDKKDAANDALRSIFKGGN